MHDAQTSTIAVPLGRAGPRRTTFGDTLRRSQPAYVLLAPYLVLFVVVLAYPLLYSIYVSVFDATLNRQPPFAGDNIFVQLFTTPEFHTALRNTFFFPFFALLVE